jgi:hypothetical protein
MDFTLGVDFTDVRFPNIEVSFSNYQRHIFSDSAAIFAAEWLIPNTNPLSENEYDVIPLNLPNSRSTNNEIIGGLFTVNAFQSTENNTLFSLDTLESILRSCRSIDDIPQIMSFDMSLIETIQEQVQSIANGDYDYITDAGSYSQTFTLIPGTYTGSTRVNDAVVLRVSISSDFITAIRTPIFLEMYPLPFGLNGNENVEPFQNTENGELEKALSSISQVTINLYGQALADRMQNLINKEIHKQGISIDGVTLAGQVRVQFTTANMAQSVLHRITTEWYEVVKNYDIESDQGSIDVIERIHRDIVELFFNSLETSNFSVFISHPGAEQESLISGIRFSCIKNNDLEYLLGDYSRISPRPEAPLFSEFNTINNARISMRGIESGVENVHGSYIRGLQEDMQRESSPGVKSKYVHPLVHPVILNMYTTNAQLLIQREELLQFLYSRFNTMIDFQEGLSTTVVAQMLNEITLNNEYTLSFSNGVNSINKFQLISAEDGDLNIDVIRGQLLDVLSKNRISYGTSYSLIDIETSPAIADGVDSGGVGYSLLTLLVKWLRTYQTRIPNDLAPRVTVRTLLFNVFVPFIASHVSWINSQPNEWYRVFDDIYEMVQFYIVDAAVNLRSTTELPRLSMQNEIYHVKFNMINSAP